MTDEGKAKRKPSDGGFSDAERAAMEERARELAAESRPRAKKSKDGEADLLAKIAEMPDADRMLAERIHALVKANAPHLAPKTWYGMPAYANPDGKVVCFFQGAAKFEARYATIGFNDAAALDDGAMWPVSFALVDMTPAEEERIAALIRRAAE